VREVLGDCLDDRVGDLGDLATLLIVVLASAVVLIGRFCAGARLGPTGFLGGSSRT
jgi:hypothetical protein